MSSRFAPSARTKAIRAVLGLAAALAVTFLIFQFMAAFNGVLKVINEMTTEMALQCPKGYNLIESLDGTPSCKAAPPPGTPGVVPVTIYAAPAPAPTKPAAPPAKKAP
jgi:hypothetical protein